jgi:ABC-type nitrate/sulfonate/bicarbonate transport system permease component
VTAATAPEASTTRTVADAPADARPPRDEPRWRAVLPPAAVAVLFVGIWYAVSYFAFPDPIRRAVLLPPPHQVVTGAFLDPGTAAELLGSLWLTTQVALVGPSS